MIGEQPWGYFGFNESFQDPAEVFSTNDAALFLTGQNVLDIQVWNGYTYSGLDYSATVNFIPEPAPTMFLGMGAFLLTAILASARKRRNR